MSQPFLSSLIRTIISYFLIYSLVLGSSTATSLFPSPSIESLDGLTAAQEVFDLGVSESELAQEQEQILAMCGEKPTGPIDATLCDYESVESANDELHDSLQDLVKLPFFKYLQIDLYRGCPFWVDDGTCTEPTCSIKNVDESEIPEEWRTKTLSKISPVSGDDTYHELEGCYYRDSDFCFLEDPKLGEFYDLTTIPERYTGYTGSSPHQIWKAIYEENCFTPSSSSRIIRDSTSPKLKEGEETCLEEKVYNKVISGLHASISTHICLDYLNQTTGIWEPNLQCYLTRVASHPERLEYIYFNTVLLLRAISRIRPYLGQYDYYLGLEESGDGSDAINSAQTSLERVIDIAGRVGRFDESKMFRGDDAIALREDFKSYFRNVSRIMDCIECDQCRLWGKVQTAGVATAMKILFELDLDVFNFTPNSSLDTILQRSELAQLFQTLNRFSESLRGAKEFRKMWLESQHSESDGETLKDDTDNSNSTNSSSIYQYCLDCAASCVDCVMRLWTRGVRSLEVFMKRENEKEGSSSLKTEL